MAVKSLRPLSSLRLYRAVFVIEPSSVLFKASGIYSLVRKCVAAGMPQHVRMACRRVGSSSEEERGNSSKVIANQVAIWT